MNHFERIRDFLFTLDIAPVENLDGNYFVITDPKRHFQDMYITLNESTLFIDQFVYDVPSDHPKYQAHLFKRLLQMSGELTHGAFILDESGGKVLFHATLALENLDLNELDTSITAITLGFEEFGRELIMLHEEAPL